jgi:hypothetical protein
MDALGRIATILDLDYAGIDFSIDAGGNVLLFEANPTMAIYLPDGDERFAYRRAAITRIVEAIRRMFRERARVRPTSRYSTAGTHPA